MAHENRKKALLKKHGLAGVNKPKRTPGHKTKSHMVLAQDGHTLKLIRFGQKGAKTAGKPKAGESDRMKAKRKSFKARHAKNIAKGKMSAAYWADKVKWQSAGLGKIMPQLGSDDKPVLMTNKKNKGRLYGPSWHGGKGAAPRVNVHSKQYRDNWDAIFNKGGKDASKKEE